MRKYTAFTFIIFSCAILYGCEDRNWKVSNTNPPIMYKEADGESYVYRNDSGHSYWEQLVYQSTGTDGTFAGPTAKDWKARTRDHIFKKSGY